ncbi:DUF2730 family protein [Salmonella enterica subsp. diarizonae]|nr:DUF2730 family protein [Salmonella enterica subsp. diarizonae]
MDIYSVLTYAVGSGGTVGGVLWWAVRRTFASTERVENIENRLTALEAKCENMPSAQDVHAVRLQTAETNGEVKALNRHMQVVTHQLELLLEKALGENNK